MSGVGGAGGRQEATPPQDDRVGESVGRQRMQATLPRVGRMHCGFGKVGVGRGANRGIGRFGIARAGFGGG